jgi:hypothetical protein
MCWRDLDRNGVPTLTQSSSSLSSAVRHYKANSMLAYQSKIIVLYQDINEDYPVRSITVHHLVHQSGMSPRLVCIIVQGFGVSSPPTI